MLYMRTLVGGGSRTVMPTLQLRKPRLQRLGGLTPTTHGKARMESYLVSRDLQDKMGPPGGGAGTTGEGQSTLKALPTSPIPHPQILIPGAQASEQLLLETWSALLY